MSREESSFGETAIPNVRWELGELWAVGSQTRSAKENSRVMKRKAK